MSCCTLALTVPALFLNTSSTETECADWCFHHPKLCSGYTHEEECRVCLDAQFRNCLPNQTPLVTRPTCHGNICVAVDGDEVYLGHETTVYISQKREKYVAYDAIPTTPGGVILKLNVTRPTGIAIIGPGVVQANLPLLLGKNLTVSNVEFRQCNGTGRAQAALLLQEGGDVVVEGTVGYHYAKSFVTVAPASPLGESVKLSDSSRIVYTGSDPSVCAAAFSRVEGKVAVHCNNTCFTVSQDLEGKDRLVLSEDSPNITTNVNLTSLLNDFGSEYLVQYVDGPSNGDSTPTAVAGILSSLTLTVLIVTVICQQRYFKFL